MEDLIKALNRGEHPDLNVFSRALSGILDLLLQFELTPQDAEWHAEGNVFIHTQSVLNEIYKIIDTEASHLSINQKLALIFAAVLHDIGKPLVTKTKEIEGLPRIVAPYHEAKGCSYLAYKLLEFNLPYSLIQEILRLVAYHHKPRRLILNNAEKREYCLLARLVNVELLYYMAKADMLGRVCKDQQAQIDNIDLFRLVCEEHQLWGIEDPYLEWKTFFNKELSHLSAESRDAVLGYAVQDYEAGLIFTPEEGVARRYPYLKSFPELVILCGPSGSGKSTWIQNHLKDYHVISLDTYREKHAKSRSDQNLNIYLRFLGKAELKAQLRKHGKVVWDATNLRKDFRSILCQLGFDYHALVTLVVFHIPESQIYSSNRSRVDDVSNQVLDNQLNALEWMEDSEAHRVAYVNRTECLDFRGACGIVSNL